MEYIIQVLMKFQPSLQLKVRTTPGNQESLATRHATSTPTDAEFAEYMQSLQVLMQDEIIEADKVEKKNTKLPYQPTNDRWMSKLDCPSNQSRYSMGSKPSSTFDHT